MNSANVDGLQCSNKAWFSLIIFKNWVLILFAPALRKFRVKKLRILPEEVKYLLILGNAPKLPFGYILCSKDGNFSCMLYIVKKTTPLIHPMDHEIIFR